MLVVPPCNDLNCSRAVLSAAYGLSEIQLTLSNQIFCNVLSNIINYYQTGIISSQMNFSISPLQPNDRGTIWMRLHCEYIRSLAPKTFFGSAPSL